MEGSSDDDDRKPAATADEVPMATTTTDAAAGDDGGGAAASSSPKNVKVKPALKKDPARHSADKHLKWDEPTIEEHDQLRGTRMKIDEPNTPYTHYDSGAESDDSHRRPKSPAQQKPALSWDTLQTRLDSVAAVREQYPPPSPGGHSDHSDADEERRREMRRLEFREHRKRHYNEMELVKKFRMEHPNALDVNDEDEGDDGDVADDEAGDGHASD